jgi:hypothetical protein
MPSGSSSQPVLKPQDLMVVLKLVVLKDKSLTYAQLARTLGMSASEVHASVMRAKEARLVRMQDGKPRPILAAVREFLLYGAKYAFPASLGAPTRGMPTAYAAPPLESKITQSNEPPPVWPDPKGSQRGSSFAPLYPTAPRAAKEDASLYQYLALFDAVRGGAARERELASQLLSDRLA